MQTKKNIEINKIAFPLRNLKLNIISIEKYNETIVALSITLTTTIITIITAYVAVVNASLIITVIIIRTNDDEYAR